MRRIDIAVEHFFRVGTRHGPCRPTFYPSLRGRGDPIVPKTYPNT